jgi:tRNA pseudouridine(55) synthase
LSPRDRSGGLDGVLIVAKPSGPTSHDVVSLVRRLSSTRRVGHGGTLDPFAAGVLPVFLGRATRLVEYHLSGTKRYRATICFGATSTTDDIDGERTPVEGPALDRDAVEGALSELTGPIKQVPPVYSAVQIEGRRAYQMARRGEPVELAPRDVVIHEAIMLEWDDSDAERPIAVVDVACSALALEAARTSARSSGRRPARSGSRTRSPSNRFASMPPMVPPASSGSCGRSMPGSSTSHMPRSRSTRSAGSARA